jgi:hypothetical protein
MAKMPSMTNYEFGDIVLVAFPQFVYRTLF